MDNVMLNLNEPERLQRVARALASELRLKILALLDGKNLNVLELSQQLQIPVSTVSNSVEVLEEAGLITTRRQKGVRGVMKVCSREAEQVTIELHRTGRREVESYFQSMPVGQYTDCRVKPVCGLLGAERLIGEMDSEASFYDSHRHEAQLLWFRQGYVEYRFSNQPLKDRTLRCMEISFEACSEVQGFCPECPSDVTVCINGVELGCWRCPGDFGGRPGRFSPAWWPVDKTQYGILTRWRVDERGCWLNDAPLSEVKLADLGLEDMPYITLRIGIRPDAEQQGGLNLFGEGFGDYQQAIVMRLDCAAKNE